MKKTRIAIVWLTLLALILTLSACGQAPDPTTAPTTKPTTAPTTAPTTVPTTAPTEPPLTAADVFANVGPAMEDAAPTRMRMDFTFDLEIAQGEGDTTVQAEMGYAMKLDTIICEEPFGNYSLVSVGIQADGMDMNMDAEIYLVEEEDEVVSYTKAFGMWARESTGMSVADYQKSDESAEISTDSVWTPSSKPIEMTLDEKTQTLNGREVYVLRCTLPLDATESAFEDAGLEIPEDLEINGFPVVYYVDAETWQVLRMEMDTEFLEKSMGATIAAALLDADTEGVDLSIEISSYTFDVGYGIQEVPAVPQEAYDYLENSQGASGGLTEPAVSGPPVLVCGAEQYQITVPEGWEADSLTQNMVWLYDRDYTVIVQILYDDESSREQLLATLDDMEDYLKSDDSLKSRGEGPAIKGYETEEILGKEEAFYYAWREMGDGWLFIEVTDGRSELSSDILTQIPDLLTPVTE